MAGYEGLGSHQTETKVSFEAINRAMTGTDVATSKSLSRLRDPFSQHAGSQEPTVTRLPLSIRGFDHPFTRTLCQAELISKRQCRNHILPAKPIECSAHLSHHAQNSRMGQFCFRCRRQ